jgi:hypothetical protein
MDRTDDPDKKWMKLLEFIRVFRAIRGFILPENNNRGQSAAVEA